MSSEKVVQEDLHKILQNVPASYHLYIFLKSDVKLIFFFFFGFKICHSYHCDVNNADRKRAPDAYQGSPITV